MKERVLDDVESAERGEVAGEVEERAAELVSALDALEDKINLLIERIGHLAERHREVDQLRRRMEGGLDPIALDERVRTLEKENERLARHARFLEAKVGELLSRVRYVVET